ncbi:NDR1/HIN1-like protein 10 [Triticum dicoccoides]|uniref:NDR1/HIN1-like protein 10 n=1 Tax=Triticum dicoccoides TaxID=85692 RepID=UPI00162DCAB8|nr:NDR1/HIN1-like protein 10 [Triticum dicoccoides]
MGSGSRAASCLCCPFKCLACGLFSCLCSILVSLLVTAGVLALILYFIFRPQMIAATVDSASLAQFALGTPASPALLQYNLTLAMTVRNPNKRVGLYYDNVEALALFDGQRFGFAPLDPFFQGHQASTEVKPAFGGQQVLEGDVTQSNLRSQLAGGAVEVEVKLNAKLRVKVWAFKVPGPRARISCPLSLPAPGAAAGAPAFKPTECKVWF